MASEPEESESPPSQSQRADPQQSQSAAKLNKVYVFFWHAYSSVMYSLYEIEVPKPLPPPPDKATQADEIEKPKKLLPVLQLQTGQYPDGMSCVSLGSKLYFFGGEFNRDNSYIDKDVKKNIKDIKRDVFPRQLLIFDLSDVGASGDESHKLLVDGEQMRSGKARPHAFVAEEKIYVIGSTIESSISHRSKLTRIENLESFKFFEVYDPKVGKWDDLPDPPIGNVKTRWVGHAIVRRKALLVAWQGGEECLYCFDLVKRRWTDASIPFYPENFSGRTEFVEDTLYGCYHNTIAAIGPVEETKIEKEEKKGKVEAEEGEKMEAEKVKAEEEEEDAIFNVPPQLHVLSEEKGMDAIFNVPPQLQSSSSLVHLGNRYFCYVISGMPPDSDIDCDDVIKDDKKRFISIVIFQALGKKYEKDGTGLLQAKFHYSAHYEINSPVPNEGFIDGCFFPGLPGGNVDGLKSSEWYSIMEYTREVFHYWIPSGSTRFAYDSIQMILANSTIEEVCNSIIAFHQPFGILTSLLTARVVQALASSLHKTRFAITLLLIMAEIVFAFAHAKINAQPHNSEYLSVFRFTYLASGFLICELLVGLLMSPLWWFMVNLCTYLILEILLYWYKKFRSIFGYRKK